jgi:LysR family cyn operon transcriptional activator
MESNALSVIIEVVRLGRFATVLPQVIACSQHGLQPVMLRPELPNHTITLICRKGAYRSPACRAFGELTAQWSTLQCQRRDRQRLRPCPLAETCREDACDCAQADLSVPPLQPVA